MCVTPTQELIVLRKYYMSCPECSCCVGPARALLRTSVFFWSWWRARSPIAAVTAFAEVDGRGASPAKKPPVRNCSPKSLPFFAWKARTSTVARSKTRRAPVAAEALRQKAMHSCRRTLFQSTPPL